MIVVRSWPKDIPAHRRAYVDDEYPRIFIDNYDHSGLAALDENVLLLEWDIAVSPEDVNRFADFALKDPSRVAAAPYRLYPVSTGLAGVVWSHRLVVSQVPWMLRWGIGERFADMVSLGMTYLPRDVIRHYLRENHGQPFTDTLFGMWHYRVIGKKIPIDWRVHPVHLHYD